METTSLQHQQMAQMSSASEDAHTQTNNSSTMYEGLNILG